MPAFGHYWLDGRWRCELRDAPLVFEYLLLIKRKIEEHFAVETRRSKTDQEVIIMQIFRPSRTR